MKRIAFLSEMGFKGKIPSNHKNMRTEFSQMHALDADHYPMLLADQVTEQYDHVVLLVGKTDTFREQLSIKFRDGLVEAVRIKMGGKVWFMQEGPVWIFKDMPLHHQFQHFNILQDVDGILTENETDIPYYRGLVGHEKPIHSIPSLMIEDLVSDLPKVEREGTMIGGTFCQWYSGFDSYIVSFELEGTRSAPRMGRWKQEETKIDIQWLPYMEWVDWIKALNERKYGVHMMPTYAAGTFAMNCSYLGIPCIGYKHVDTQRILHPLLSCENEDLDKAVHMAQKLNDDPDFYRSCSETTKKRYELYWTKERFLEKMEGVFV